MRNVSVSRVIILLTIATLGLLAFSLYQYDQKPILNKTIGVYIPSESSESLYKSLEDAGATLNIWDRLMFYCIELPTEGWYKIDATKSSRISLLKNLHKERDKTINIVIFAGDTAAEMLHRLSNDMKLNLSELQKNYRLYARFEEGNFLAGRYTLGRLADAKTAIKYLLDQSYKELDFFARDRFGLSFTREELYNTIIIASIIQKESNDIEEMSYISSVIRNRLKKKMRLQMDGTLNYGKYAHTIVTSQRIKNDTSLYNTYKHKGLPPAPLSIVSMDALEAVTFPRESDYLFFMLNKTGKHDFASTYKEHLQNVRTFKIYCKERNAKREAEKKASLSHQKRSKIKKEVTKTIETNSTVESLEEKKQRIKTHMTLEIHNKNSSSK